MRTLAGVDIRESTLLPMGAYALTMNGHVVWDSVTQQPPGLPSDPSRWNGVLVSTLDYLALRVGEPEGGA